MTWAQVYDPFGNRLLSTAVAALPVLTLNDAGEPFPCGASVVSASTRTS